MKTKIFGKSFTVSGKTKHTAVAQNDERLPDVKAGDLASEVSENGDRVVVGKFVWVSSNQAEVKFFDDGRENEIISLCDLREIPEDILKNKNEVYMSNTLGKSGAANALTSLQSGLKTIDAQLSLTKDAAEGKKLLREKLSLQHAKLGEAVEELSTNVASIIVLVKGLVKANKDFEKIMREIPNE